MVRAISYLEKAQTVLGKTSDHFVVALIGFNNSQEFAKYLKTAGFRIAAVSDKTSGLVDYGGNGGLNISELIDFKSRGCEFKEFKKDKVKNTRPEFLIKMEVDVLAIEDKKFLDEENAEDIRAKMVLKIKNGVISKGVLRILKEKQIPVVSLF